MLDDHPLLDFEEFIDLGYDDDNAPRCGLGIPTATDNLAGAVPLYSHGYSVRVDLLLPYEQATRLIDAHQWSPSRRPSSWILWHRKDGTLRAQMRGSAWLTHRKPRDKRHSITRLNSSSKTHLYAVVFEFGADRVSIDLAGVRHSDVQRFVEVVLGIPSDGWAIRHYRQMERYIVLTAPEAARLAEGLGHLPSSGKSRLARKRFLVSAHEYPVKIRKRTQATATLAVYRIDRGATSLFRCEIMLKGKTHDRRTFHEADIKKLDHILLDLVDEYDLNPIGKPDRWEPRDLGSPLQQGPFCEKTRKLPQAAWRGARMKATPRSIVKKCHTPNAVKLYVCEGYSEGCPPEPVVRGGYPTSPTSNTTLRASKNTSSTGISGDELQFTSWDIQDARPWIFTSYRRANTPSAVAPQRPSPRFHSGGEWEALSDEISRVPRGMLVEVVLDDHQDPAPLIDALASDEGTLGLCVYAAKDGRDSNVPSTWYSVRERLGQHPVLGPVEILAVVVDTSVDEAILEAVLDGMRDDTVVVPGFGPLGDGWRTEWGLVPLVVRANAAWWWEKFEFARAACEANGTKTVFITTDARTSWGRGPMQNSHHFRDHRVRSWVGDAGRYWCHQRYRVEPDGLGRPYRVVAIKDEVEGLVGRLVYDNGKQVI